MYVKPTLQRFGTFRELTLIGLTNNSDGASILSVNSPGSGFRNARQEEEFFERYPKDQWELGTTAQHTS
jgi:hypothetical protein